MQFDITPNGIIRSVGIDMSNGTEEVGEAPAKKPCCEQQPVDYSDHKLMNLITTGKSNAQMAKEAADKIEEIRKAKFYLISGSSSENNRPIWLPILIRDNFFTGQLFYDDFEVRLTYEKESTHERTVDLVYSKKDIEGALLAMSVKLEDDADLKKLLSHDVQVKADFTVKALDGLLNLNGAVQNVNYMVVDGIKVSKCMKEGCTTEAECNSLTADFNNNIKLTLTLQDMPIGDIYMGTLYDEVTKRFYPTIMVHADLLGKEDYTLTNLLEMMGVDVPTILKNAAEMAQSE